MRSLNHLLRCIRPVSASNVVFLRLTLLVGLFGVLFFTPFIANEDTARAAINRQLPFSARLKTTAGDIAPDGNYDIVFSIYTVDSGGSAVWTETQSVASSTGIIYVNLGSVTPIPTSLTFNDATYYLGIKVGNDAEMAPRKVIGAVPLALNADTLDGLDPGTSANNLLQLDSSGNITIQGGGSFGGNVAVTGQLQGGTALINGITTVGGNIIPTTGGTFDLGSNAKHFANAYIDNLSVGSTNTTGTSGSSFTINTAVSGDADSALNFYRGGALPSASLLWNSATGLFNLTNGLQVTSADAAKIGLIVKAAASQSANLFEIQNSSGTALVKVDASGNMGIGIVNPGEKLQVAGGNILLDNNMGYYIKDSGGTNQPVISMTSGNTLQVLNFATGGNINIAAGNNAGAIKFLTGASITERVRIDTAGNVGIGTTSPADVLHVNGNARLGAATTSLTTVSDNPLTSGATTVNVASTTGYATSGTLLIDSEAMTYTGTTATSFTGVTRARFGTSAASHSSGASVNAYMLNVATSTTAASQFLVTANGNVGIGTATPTQPLTVNGNAQLLTGNLYVGSGTTGNGNIYSTNNGTGGGRLILYQPSHAGLPGAIQVANGASVTATFSGNGTVGIGTQTPSEVLHVAGNARLGAATTSLTTVTDNPLTSGATTVNVASTTGYPTSGTLLIDSEAMTYTGTTATSFTGVTRAQFGTSAASHSSGASVNAYLLNVATSTTATPKLLVTANGNVGIGTTAPVARLDVRGPSDGSTPAASLRSTNSNNVALRVFNSAANKQVDFGFSSDDATAIVSASTGVPLQLRPGVNVALNLVDTGGGITIGASTTLPGNDRTAVSSELRLLHANVATANYGLFSIGPVATAFDGSTSGFFAGSSSGTQLAINAVSGFAGNLADWQVAGSSKFKVDASGNITIAGTLTGSGSGTVGYWSRSGTTISPATSGDVLSMPGSGASSERFGAGASTGVRTNSLAVGNGATVSGDFSVAIGEIASASSNNAVAVGRNASAGSAGIGIGSSANGGTGIAIGVSSSTGAADAIVIGRSAGATGQDAIAIGLSSSSNSIGSIALGSGASTTATGQFVVGSNSRNITNAYMGNGFTNASPVAFTLNATGGSGSNIAGAALQLAGGKGTGTGVGGNILFQYAPAGLTGSSLNALQTACTISGTNGSLSCPGAGASSERFGSGAAAAGANGTAVGVSASSAGLSTIAVGSLASATGDFSIAIGRAASAASGDGSNVGAVAVGRSATASALGATALGDQASATNSSATALGSATSASGTFSIAIGRNAITAFDSAIAIGRDSITTAANQLVFGSGNSPISDIYFGKGVTNATPTAYTLNGTGGSGTNIAGAALQLAGGKGTGTGVGGNILFQYAPAGSTGSSLNSLQTACTISGTDGTLSCNGGQTNSEVFGSGATVGGARSIAIGRLAISGTSTDNVVIGYNSNAGNGLQNVIVGATTALSGTINDNVLIGYGVTSSNQRNTVIGSGGIGGFESIAIGRQASSTGTGSIAIGIGATTTASNQLVFGSNTESITAGYIGNGVTNASPAAFTLNATGGSGTNIAGANLLFAGGKGTGNAAGGSIQFQTSDAGGSGATLQNLTTKMTLLPSGFLGIGTTGPSTYLEVFNASAGGDYAFFNRGGNGVKVNLTSALNQITSTGKTFNIFTTDAQSLNLGTNNSPTAITILSGGNVGIGVSPSTFLHAQLQADVSSGNVVTFDSATGVELTASSGSQSWLSIAPKINQTSTAGYTGILLNVTETATGSGAKNLMDLQVGSTSKFKVDNSGNLSIGGVQVCTSSGCTATGSAATTATMWHDQSTVVTGNAFLDVLNTSQRYGSFTHQNTSADGDIFEQKFFLKAGTYTFNVLGVTDSNRAKIDWKIDGTNIVTGQDWYSGATTYNVVKSTASVTVTGDGEHTLRGTINGHNVLSSGYLMTLTKMWLKP